MGRSATSDIATDEPEESAEAPRRDRALWRGGVAPLSPLAVALVWLRRSGSFLVPMALGVLVTATLLCTVPLYVRLTSDVQLQYLLATTPKPDVNIEAQVALASTAADDATAADMAAHQLGRQYLSGFAPTSMSFLDASNVAFTSVNDAPLDSGPNLIHGKLATAEGRPTAFDFAQADPHMRLYAGRLPRDVGPDQMPEVLATPKLDVQVGDIIGLKQLGVADTNVRARVVGIWFPKDQNDPFWNGHSYDTVNNCGEVCPPDIYPLLFTHSGFFQAIASFKEPSPQNFNANPYFVNVHEVYFTQPSRLHVSDIPTTLDLIGSFLRDLDYSTSRTHSVSIITQLDTLLVTLNRAQVVSLMLLFIFTVAALVIEERAGAIMALKSRGASRTQLLLSFGLLAIVPAALMAAAGALLASWAAVELILTLDPVAASVVGAGYYATEAPPQAVTTPAMIAAALGVLVVVAAAWLATRGSALAYRRERGRASRAPFWKRYYLDLMLAVICLAGYVELAAFGGFGIRSQLGTASVGADPLQVAAPALLVLSGALIAMRVMGPAARLCARIAMRGRGAPRVLAFTQVARASGQFTRLALLVTLAVAFGFFALTYQGVLMRNASERAAYAAGGDQLMTLDNSIQGTAYVETLQSHIGGLPGVQAATPIVRSPAKASPDLGGGTVGMLGIDPATFARVAYWRNDFADQPLQSLLDQMRSHAQGALAGDEAHPIWALVSSAFAANLNVTVGDHISLVLYAGRAGTLNVSVGAIVNDFPTMYNSTNDGYVVVDEQDLVSAYANPDIGNLPGHGATEYWLRTTGRPSDDTRRTQALQQLQLDPFVTSITDRRTLAKQFQSDPVAVGMGGLLLVGAALAALLAALASVLQARATASQRLVQFAVMRTLGMTRRQLRAMVMYEHMLLYAFGLIGGTLLGLLLTSATLPFLSFASALQDPATVGVPPYVLSFNPPAVGILYAALIAMFAAALLLEAWLANRAGLGRALRIGED